jgi:flagellin
MTVSTIATIAAGLSRTLSNQNTGRSSAVLGSLLNASGKPAADIAQLSAAANLQNQIAQFRVASQNIAQASGLLAAANQGIGEIAREIGRLRDIAVRASGADLNANERAELNTEFQSIRQKIDRIVRSTRFNGEALLDGTSPQLNLQVDGKTQQNVSVGSLTDATLFKGTNPDVSTASGAKVAEATLKAAQDYVTAQATVVSALQDGIDFAAAAVESAMQNQDAARSTLDEADLLGQLLGGQTQQSTSAASLLAQSNKLPGGILQLLAE